MKSLYLLLIIVVISFAGCDSSTESKDIKLSGSVTIDGLADHSGIKVGLYKTAVIDHRIAEANSDYPFAGVIRTQKNSFDHRTLTPVATDTTNAEGKFTFNKVAKGSYNIVAIKKGYGFSYTTDINIGSNKNNTLLEPMVLYSEETISFDIEQNKDFLANHHYIIENNIFFRQNACINIHAGAVIRLKSNARLIIDSRTGISGTADTPIRITSDHGFSEDLEQTVAEDILPFDFVSVSSTATIMGTNISGIWIDYTANGLQLSNAEVNISDVIVENCNKGLLVINSQSVHITNILGYKTFDYAIRLETIQSGEVRNNIIIDCDEAITSYNYSHPDIVNNYIKECDWGISSFAHSENKIYQNTIIGNRENSIETGGFNSPEIYHNQIEGEDGIRVSNRYHQGHSTPSIHHNNLNCTRWAIDHLATNEDAEEDISAPNNYFYTTDEAIVKQKIQDRDDFPTSNLGYVLYTPFLNHPISAPEVGIQSE